MKEPKWRKCLKCGKRFTEESLLCSACDAKPTKIKKLRAKRKSK